MNRRFEYGDIFGRENFYLFFWFKFLVEMVKKCDVLFMVELYLIVKVVY